MHGATDVRRGAEGATRLWQGRVRKPAGRAWGGKAEGSEPMPKPSTSATSDADAEDALPGPAFSPITVHTSTVTAQDTSPRGQRTTLVPEAAQMSSLATCNPASKTTDVMRRTRSSAPNPPFKPHTHLQLTAFTSTSSSRKSGHQEEHMYTKSAGAREAILDSEHD